IAAVDDANLDVERTFSHAHPAHRIEVSSLHLSVLHDDSIEQHRVEAVDEAAFHLRSNVIRVDRKAAIDRAPCAMNRELVAFAYAHFDDARRVRAEREVPGDAKCRAGRTFAIPSSQLGRGFIALRHAPRMYLRARPMLDRSS